ncbi:cell envelope integrity protein TolA [Hydrogenophaga taeniospiralis]|uniref:cell envelope integrity protein TolA n=1 Tax=Hydrogenophaga taeniospiralis TaxID=65656 RepID=UPI00243547F7|nr:cell envelope integrity protein TolA [Hydrogenophaga taeniospiralis]
MKQADIATEQAKKKRLEEERREAAELKAKQAAKEKAEEKAREKKELDKQKAEEAKKDARKKAEEKKLADQKREAQERREAELAKKARDDQMRRILGQAGASGGPEARGSAQRSSGPSSGYGAKVAAKIKPNIIPTRDYPSNLKTVIYLGLLPDGTIASRRISQSSGNAAWDEEALRAIDRTRTVPRDTDGSVPPYGEVVLSPND